MKILVTGSRGQLGQAIMNSSHAGGHEFIFSARQTIPAENAPATKVQAAVCGPQYHPLDITDPAAVNALIQNEGIELIINCAAYTDVAKAETESENAHLINAKAVANLAAAAKTHDAVLIHISTDYVFDGNATSPYKETDCTNPVNEYGKSKLAGEKAILDSGCKYLIFRTSWLYGCYGKNFVKTILKKAQDIRKSQDANQTINVVSDQIGNPTYAPDLVEAIFEIINNNQLPKDDNRGRGGIYNFSNEGQCSWYEFAAEICRQSAKPDQTNPKVLPCTTADYPSNVRRPSYSVLDKTKFKETFHQDIPHWSQSLSKCLKEIEKFG